MSGIILPSKFDKIKCGMGIITPGIKKELESCKYFTDNYDLIAHYKPMLYQNGSRIYVEECELDSNYISSKKVDAEKNAKKLAALDVLAPDNGSEIIDTRKFMKQIQPERVCRFCGKKKPEVKFNKKAHAISELVGNKTVFLWNECDNCNSLFGKEYEDSFSKFMGPERTIAQTYGKDGVPKFEDYTARIEVGEQSTVIQEIDHSNHIELIEEGLELHLKKQTYCPLNAFKALVVMALSIMPERELKKFSSTVDWIIKRGKYANYDFHNYSSNVIFSFIGGIKPQQVQTWVFRRKSHLYGGMGVFEVPYCLFILEFDNFSFQIIVPNYEQDSYLWNKCITVPEFFSTSKYYQISGMKASSEIRDLSSEEMVTGEEVHMIIHADEKIELTEELGKSVQELVDKEGVKPLFPRMKEGENHMDN